MGAEGSPAIAGKSGGKVIPLNPPPIQSELFFIALVGPSDILSVNRVANGLNGRRTKPLAATNANAQASQIARVPDRLILDQPVRMLDDGAVIKGARRVEAIVAVDDGLDPAAFAALLK